MVRLPEREDICGRAGLEESDLQRPLADRVVLAHELVQAAVPEQAVAVLVDIHAVRGAGSLAVEEHPKRNPLARFGSEHEMRVARVEAEGDAAAGLVENDILAPDRPLASEGPVVQRQ